MEAIAITGMGAVSAAGPAVRDLWDAVAAGRSLARPISHFDTGGMPGAIACEVDASPLPSWLDEAVPGIHPYSRYALSAASAAISDAGVASAAPERVGVLAGTAGGGVHQPADQDFTGSPVAAASAAFDAPIWLISALFGFKGISFTLTTACSSSTHAIGEGSRLLNDNEADVIIAGGADATVARFVVEGFSQLKAMTTRVGPPDQACRPFDITRDGCLVGEGAAFCVLERAADARARGARIYAYVLGYGRTADANHLVMPHNEGVGASRSMSLALEDAGVAPADVAAVNAHGTGTRQNDLSEARAVRAVFRNSPPPVMSIKGTVGHMMGAAGAAEAVVSALTLERGFIPPTANYRDADPECGIDVVSGCGRALGAGVVVSNSFAFGGQNGTLVLAAGGPSTTTDHFSSTSAHQREKS